MNEVSRQMHLLPLGVKDALCNEIDTPDDLEIVKNKVEELESRTVYMCFSTDMLHSGHIAIIKKAQKLGKVIIGVLSDEAVASYKRFPLMPFEERKMLVKNISGVHQVVEQKALSYAENIRSLRPPYGVHGEAWKQGFQAPVRDEVGDLL